MHPITSSDQLKHQHVLYADKDRWTVFGPDGARIAVVEMPTGLTLLDVGRDAVLALWVDELDIEYVRLYRLRS